ncbi:hypothetical protein Acr_01g0008270 [Actinidia rufa]|uniref:Uncharacterized protein n=1 Tax=Actinidia rufa TaxID=165716 RepID=A0A7J0E3J4_9ERIC|nr:hypothetical protein Acr_01g0008270 [Actinidia rufa]
MEILSIQQHARDTLSRLRMRKRDKNWARDHMKHHTRTAGLRAGLHGQGLDWAARGWGWAARGVCWLLAAQGWAAAQAGLLAAQGWLHKGCVGLGCTGWLRKGCAGLGCLDKGCAGVAAGLHGVAAGCWLHKGWLLTAQRLGVVAALVAVGFRVWAAVKAE